MKKSILSPNDLVDDKGLFTVLIQSKSKNTYKQKQMETICEFVKKKNKKYMASLIYNLPSKNRNVSRVQTANESAIVYDNGTTCATTFPDANLTAALPLKYSLK